MESTILGGQASEIVSDAWYSIQSFSTDYYLGVTHTTGAQIQLLSDVDDSTLWQFIPAGPDASRGVYAMRSKSSDGFFCLYTNSSIPTPVPCGTDAGQIQIFNSASGDSTDDGVVLVPYADQRATALSAPGDAQEGEPVEFASVASGDNSEEVELLWALRSRSAVDVAAYPTLVNTSLHRPSHMLPHADLRPQSPTYNAPATVSPTTVTLSNLSTTSKSTSSVTSTFSDSEVTPALVPTISVDTSRTIVSEVPTTNVTVSLTSTSSGEQSAPTFTLATEVTPSSSGTSETESTTPAVQSTNSAAVAMPKTGVAFVALGLACLGLWI